MKLLNVLITGVCLLATTSSVAQDSATDRDLSPAIIGGQQASPNQLPFFARLIIHTMGSRQFFNICGGSIINDRFILTAAHCVEDSVFTDGWSKDDLNVLVDNPTMDNVSVDEFIDVKSITLHPNYDASRLWLNDIAILELSKPITANVQSITLPQDFGDYSNRSVYQIFGLGQTSTEDTGGPNYLRWAEVQPLTDSECSALVNGYNAEESLCANGFEDRDYTGVCRGDSGGPLTYKDDNGNYQQIGVVSYGSTVCENPSFPSVFSELLHYTSWIEAQTSAGQKTEYDETSDNNDSSSLKSGNGGGGSIGAGMLLFSVCVGWWRRRRQQ